jgi:hypothetical protein
MQGEKGGRYYLSQGSQNTQPQMDENNMQNNDEQNPEMTQAQQQQNPLQQDTEEKPEPKIEQVKETEDVKLQRLGYVKVEKDRLLKTIKNIIEKPDEGNSKAVDRVKEDKNAVVKDNKEDKENIIKNIDSIVKMEENAALIDSFLKGYKELAILGREYPDNHVNNLYQKASKINNDLLLNGFLKGNEFCDRIEKVISIDSIAHELHVISRDVIKNERISKMMGTTGTESIRGRWSVLNELAEISKDLGETERDDRILILSQIPCDIDKLNKLNNIEIFRKGDFDSSKSFWNLAKKAIKYGMDKLTDSELVLLREWIYSRI